MIEKREIAAKGRCAVTGANGYLGSRIAKAFATTAGRHTNCIIDD